MMSLVNNNGSNTLWRVVSLMTWLCSNTSGWSKIIWALCRRLELESLRSVLAFMTQTFVKAVNFSTWSCIKAFSAKTTKAAACWESESLLRKSKMKPKLWYTSDLPKPIGKTAKTSLFIITIAFKIWYSVLSSSSVHCMPFWNTSTSTLSLDTML